MAASWPLPVTSQQTQAPIRQRLHQLFCLFTLCKVQHLWCACRNILIQPWPLQLICWIRLWEQGTASNHRLTEVCDLGALMVFGFIRFRTSVCVVLSWGFQPRADHTSSSAHHLDQVVGDSKQPQLRQGGHWRYVCEPVVLQEEVCEDGKLRQHRTTQRAES